MTDAIYLLVFVASFAAFAGLIRLCDAIVRGGVPDDAAGSEDAVSSAGAGA